MDISGTPNYYCPDCECGYGDSRTTCKYCGETLCIAPRIQYVNAYRVELAYGGPEEGGWYYNVQTPIASIPFDTHRDKDGSIEDSHTAYLKTLFPNPDNKHSVMGGAHDIAVYTEYHMARDKPDERPHYE